MVRDVALRSWHLLITLGGLLIVFGDIVDSCLAVPLRWSDCSTAGLASFIIELVGAACIVAGVALWFLSVRGERGLSSDPLNP
ncbi:MAG: hypothetical protein KGJ23_10030 [Euryarchaeota archaeon]|nr:hypothetical protein [Euryarchaeota archaeon]MDE1836942.1 hypothetical protein [Euryarchaeota archaeon]MDE1881903.1 hypothetical protein [Euryarchaeota archaeon]MDE2045873.1 hypothetical protein [Thermoplasmata archaeon]